MNGQIFSGYKPRQLETKFHRFDERAGLRNVGLLFLIKVACSLRKRYHFTLL
jgi:hypothetical protein